MADKSPPTHKNLDAEKTAPISPKSMNTSTPFLPPDEDITLKVVSSKVFFVSHHIHSSKPNIFSSK